MLLILGNGTLWMETTIYGPQTASAFRTVIQLRSRTGHPGLGAAASWSAPCPAASTASATPAGP